MGNQVYGYGYNQYPNQVNYQMYQNPIMVNQNIQNNVHINLYKIYSTLILKEWGNIIQRQMI